MAKVSKIYSASFPAKDWPIQKFPSYAEMMNGLNPPKSKVTQPKMYVVSAPSDELLTSKVDELYVGSNAWTEATSWVTGSWATLYEYNGGGYSYGGSGSAYDETADPNVGGPVEPLW